MDINKIKNDIKNKIVAVKGKIDFEKIKAAILKIKIDKIKKKRLWIIVAVVLTVLLFTRGCANIRRVLFRRKSPTESVEVVSDLTPVKVYKTKRMDFKDTLPALGGIKGYKEIPLKFQVSGVIESFNFEEGERIQEGDIIANLEQKDALLKLRYAELELNKTKKMLEVGGVIEDAVEKARLEYDSAKSDLEKTNIYAVSDGLLASQEIDVGTYVTPNEEIGKFVDITKVYAEFNVIEKDVPKLKLGQKSEIFVDAMPNRNFVGTIDTVAPIIEGRTRTQRVKVELKNPEGVLKPGMFARGLIATYEKKDALIIPASSLKKTEEGYVVFVVHREEPAEVEVEESQEEMEEAGDIGVVEVRPIKIGYMTQDQIEVEKGLEDGELVVVELYKELQDKERVEIAEVQEILY
ncbi:MAG: efflux RND transporter periplasmic adaptor subunit [Candidatus Omnitrophica bacterium]|nr:efflux RND transporter periplasmic adaptor subunit [Candidatus Omnitrophota bacterium]